MVASVRLDGDLFGRSQSYNQASFEQNNALNMNNVNNHMHRSVTVNLNIKAVVTSDCKGNYQLVIEIRWVPKPFKLTTNFDPFFAAHLNTKNYISAYHT